ncbi:MAG: hypothetical protein ABL876_14475 [Chitinophagaceae bacterium]
MKYSYLAIAAVTVLVIACGKDKFTTIPQVEIKSISPTTVSHGDVLNMKGKFTDQEGDVDSVLIVYKWYNGATVVRKDTFRYSFDVLDIPVKTRQGDIEITFEYNTNNIPDLVPLPGVSIRDTTATLGLVLMDKAANRSDYKESEQIRLKKP